jgi:hypothetical protein
MVMRGALVAAPASARWAERAGVLVMSKVAKIAMMVFTGQSLALWVLGQVLQDIGWSAIALGVFVRSQNYLSTRS